jgi:hypothetical protein
MAREGMIGRYQLQAKQFDKSGKPRPKYRQKDSSSPSAVFSAVPKTLSYGTNDRRFYYRSKHENDSKDSNSSYNRYYHTENRHYYNDFKSDFKPLPIPKGNLPYARAKRAEYLERNLQKAEHYYRLAIESSDRAESAVKDLASLLHQQGRTVEAVNVLENNAHVICEEYDKYRHLLDNLTKQLVPSANCLNKFLKISGLSAATKATEVINLFTKKEKIQDVEIRNETTNRLTSYYAIVKFCSHSAARKTLDAFQHWDSVKVEWMTEDGEVKGDANPRSFKIEQMKKNPVFEYSLFERDPQNWILTMPVGEDQVLCSCAKVDARVCEGLLGSELFSTIWEMRVC